MNDQERRAEILKAEEAIQQLGAGMSMAAEAREQAARAAAALTAVREELAELRQALDSAAGQMSDAVSSAHASVSGTATAALTSAAERFDEAMKQLPGVVGKLETTATLIAAMPNQAADVIKLELGPAVAKLVEVGSSQKALSLQLAEIRQALSMDLDVKLREVIASTKWASFMAAVAALAAIVAIIVRFL
jgi:ABC-type transporter Mla subunit MlaD